MDQSSLLPGHDANNNAAEKVDQICRTPSRFVICHTTGRLASKDWRTMDSMKQSKMQSHKNRFARERPDKPSRSHNSTKISLRRRQNDLSQVLRTSSMSQVTQTIQFRSRFTLHGVKNKTKNFKSSRSLQWKRRFAKRPEKLKCRKGCFERNGGLVNNRS
ncbi:unnamed protein product [Caenorhabditis brenneri]